MQESKNQNQKNKYDVETFLKAVNLLFHSNDKNMRVQANKYLLDFETKVESWDVSFEVIAKDNIPEEGYYNALNILKRKIKYDFGNFSEKPGYIEKLLSFLGTNIDRFKKSKHYILKNYCECVGKAFLFTGDKFNNILKEFSMKLFNGNNSDIESVISLLLIFYYICETSNDASMVIDEKSRQKIRNNIKDITNDVFQYIIFMINKLNTLNDNNLKQFISNIILDTLNEYLYIDLDENILLKFNNEFLPIINFIFDINEENLEKHSDCICNLLNFPLYLDKMKPLSQIIFPKILQFKDIFYKSIESLDEEQISFYIDVFTSMIENNYDDILKEKRYDFFQIIVDLTRKCPPNKITSIAEFFNDFNNYLNVNDYKIDFILGEFRNIFINLMINLISLTRYENDVFAKLNVSHTNSLNNDDDYNNIKDYREIVKDIIEDFVYYYNYTFLFDDILFPEFKTIINKIKENQKEIANWSKMENLLYIFSCIIKDIDIKDKSINKVIILLYTIFDIPKEFIQITRTATEIIDKCPKEIISKEKDLVLNCLKYLVNGLDNKLILKYCSISAKELLIKNKEIMSEIRNDLLSLYENKLSKKLLESSKYLYIVEGIITVVTYSNGNNTNNYNIIKNTIISLMKVWILNYKAAKSLLEQNNGLSPEQNENLNHILIILKGISKAAFEGLNDENKKIMYEILSEIWPCIIFILDKMSTDKDIAENTIQLIKAYMRGLKDDFIKFIPDYVKCIINGYNLSPISSYLYAYEILVTVFPWPKDDQIKSLLCKTFNELCTKTLNGYIKKEFDLNIFVQIGEDFFGLLYRIMNLSPFILSELFDNLIDSSLKYIGTQQIQIAKNIMVFLRFVIKFKYLKSYKNLAEKNIEEAEQYAIKIQKKIENFSSYLCKIILDIYMEASVEQIRECITELFTEFIEYQKPLVLNGMKIHLVDFPNDILTNKEKNEFIDLIDKFSLQNNKDELISFIFEVLVNRCINKQVRNRGENINKIN